MSPVWRQATGFVNSQEKDCQRKTRLIVRGGRGKVITVNGVAFKWHPSYDGSENVVYSAMPTYNGRVVTGVPGIPQPPANTDGVQFGFHRDDYSKASWTANGTCTDPQSLLPQPPDHGHMVWRNSRNLVTYQHIISNS